MSAPDALAGERWRRADGTFIDPVCGMTVRPDGPHACVHGGVEFRFCNPRCRERFIADPQHWLAPQPDADAAIAGDPAPPGTAWVCPMCPEVHESAPGPCPRCGMALEPELPGADDAAAAAEQADFRRRLWLAVPATVATMALGMAMALPWLQALLATPVVLWSGWPLLERARASVRNRSVNMFTLIGLGVGLAWGWSLLVVLWPGAIAAPLRVLHFEAATGIVTLVLVGQLLEMRARASAGSALRALLALTPPVVHRLDAEGQVEDVDVAAVRPGDRLRVRPGEAFAVDGVVLDGDSAIDQSLLTGESAPLPCGPGDAVHAGCVNGAGPLVVEARGSGDHTVLARIIRQVAAAQRSRAPVQALVDRVAAVFVPAVIGIAGLAAVVWFAVGPAPAFAHALQVAITVLIVACPCALGLATPMAVLVASGRGARAGVLFRDAGAIERMAQVDTVLVDKTGTLTVGRPELADLWIDPASGLDDAAVLGLALALEQASEHPLARAVVDAARARGLAAAAVGALAVTPGRGIAGDVGGRRVALGNPQWVVDGAADAPDALVAELARSVREGGTAVLLAVDGRVVALFALVDAVRPGAAEWVTELREAGIDVRMATGDAVEAARRVAAQVGIADLRASLTPDAKLAWVRELQAAGRVVAMAGDGINDAPALAAADVGVAMGSGTDVAMQTAAVTLVGGDLGALLRARRLSAAARRVIRQNLLLAFGYNLFAVPVAAGVLYPLTGTLVAPMLAAAAMSASSLAVIGNALRLRGVWLG